MFASTPQSIHRALSFVGVSVLLPYVKSRETSMPKGPKHAVKKAILPSENLFFDEMVGINMF